MSQFARVAVASRAFSVAAILGLALALDNRAAVQVTLIVTALAATSAYLTYATNLPIHWVTAVEAGFASFAVAQALPDSLLLLPYLVLLPMVGGLARGVQGAFLSIAMQLGATTALTLAPAGLSGVDDRAELLAPWSLTIIGSGLLGAWIRKLGKSPARSRAVEQYEAARRLLGQLRALARRLSSGLDPVEISDQILLLTHRWLQDERSALFIRTDGGAFAPLSYRGPGAAELIDPNDPSLARCWKTSSVVTVDPETSEGDRPGGLILPLRVGAGTLGVLVSSSPLEGELSDIDAFMRELEELCLRLDTALAFDEVRSLVTTDERQRLAREIHDGVAQEVASIGYLVDEITTKTEDPEIGQALGQLRSELSRVVTELRLSIFDLRANVGTSGGLGSALSEHARTIGRQSGITVHLTLDEDPTRLTPMVETELLRIAQEAITNARKHSAAKNLWIDCQVRPPAARIRIRDDGRGLGLGRADSFGLRIMKERADRIGAQLSFDGQEPDAGLSGTCVTISVGEANTSQLAERLPR